MGWPPQRCRRCRSRQSAASRDRDALRTAFCSLKDDAAAASALVCASGCAVDPQLATFAARQGPCAMVWTRAVKSTGNEESRRSEFRFALRRAPRGGRSNDDPRAPSPLATLPPLWMPHQLKPPPVLPLSQLRGCGLQEPGPARRGTSIGSATRWRTREEQGAVRCCAGRVDRSARESNSRAVSEEQSRRSECQVDSTMGRRGLRHTWPLRLAALQQRAPQLAPQGCGQQRRHGVAGLSVEGGCEGWRPSQELEDTVGRTSAAQLWQQQASTQVQLLAWRYCSATVPWTSSASSTQPSSQLLIWLRVPRATRHWRRLPLRLPLPPPSKAALAR